MSNKLVLVSGASGYVGSHVASAFLSAGYRVRGTVRSLAKKEKIAHLQKMIDEGKKLELVEADLLIADSWDKAVDGCDFIAHTASPFFISCPDSQAEEKLYKPAKQGTLNVLSAAMKHGVKKVVLTSSMAAIAAGHKREGKTTHLDEPEKQWSITDSKLCDNYSRSKTIAEKAAWEFVETAKKSGNEVFELATINPVLVTGPVLSRNWCQSADIAKSFVDGSIPMIPNMQMNVVDVRDVARAHVLAIEKPEASGERFLVNAESLNFRNWAQHLAEEFRPLGFKVPTKNMPYWLCWTLSWFMSKLRIVQRNWGKSSTASNQKSRDVLGLEYIPASKSVVEMIHSMAQVHYPGIAVPKAYKEKYPDAFQDNRKSDE